MGTCCCKHLSVGHSCKNFIFIDFLRLSLNLKVICKQIVDLIVPVGLPPAWYFSAKSSAAQSTNLRNAYSPPPHPPFLPLEMSYIPSHSFQCTFVGLKLHTIPIPSHPTCFCPCSLYLSSHTFLPLQLTEVTTPRKHLFSW